MKRERDDNPRLAPALARGRHGSGASGRPKARPAPACALDDVPDFRRQVEAAQERARERRGEREQRSEMERAKLKSALTGAPEPPRSDAPPEGASEQTAPPAHHHRASESGRAWSALARHAAVAAQTEE